MPDATKLPVCKLCGAEANPSYAMGQRVVGAQCSDENCPLSQHNFDVADWQKLNGTPALAPEHVEALRAVLDQVVPVFPRSGERIAAAIRAALAALGVEVEH